MINYILLVSRQGIVLPPIPPTFFRARTLKEARVPQRQSQITKMVHHDVSEGQSQNRQGRHPARAREADEDV